MPAHKVWTCPRGHDIRSVGRRDGCCKQCLRERARRNTRARYVRNRNRLDAFKGERGCTACGYDRCVSALHCHHTDPSSKVDDVARMLGGGWGRIERELAHCVVLCANCHIELHQEDVYARLVSC